MDEWTVIKMMLEESTDVDLIEWVSTAAEWAESRREGKAELGKRLGRAVAREIKLRG